MNIKFFIFATPIVLAGIFTAHHLGLFDSLHDDERYTSNDKIQEERENKKKEYNQPISNDTEATLTPHTLVSEDQAKRSNLNNKVSIKPEKISITNKTKNAPISETKRVDGLFKNKDGKVPTFSERTQVLRNIGKNLTLPERTRLYEFLREAPNDKYTIALKDSIMVKIEKQGKYIPEYVDELSSIALDLEINGDLRGYAVQHLRGIYPITKDSERAKIKETLYEGLKDVTSDVSGTSLLALVNLQKRYNHFDDNIIDQATKDLSTNDNVHLSSRTSAMQLAGKRNLVDVLPTARIKAIKGEDYVMKVASIATLGDIGTKEDLNLVNEIIENKRMKVLHETAKISMKKIENRLK